MYNRDDDGGLLGIAIVLAIILMVVYIVIAVAVAALIVGAVLGMFFGGKTAIGNYIRAFKKNMIDSNSVRIVR